jgi:hypothetical protein
MYVWVIGSTCREEEKRKDGEREGRGVRGAGPI